MIRRAWVASDRDSAVRSALSLITAQHRSRSLFIDLERAQLDAKRLDVDHDRCASISRACRNRLYVVVRSAQDRKGAGRCGRRCF